MKHAVIERNYLEAIEHPNICRLYYSFQDACNVYLVLEYLNGGDLRTVLGYHQWTEEEAKPFILEISSALDYLHGLNIVHRDVKPEV